MTFPFLLFTYAVTWCITLFCLMAVRGLSVKKKLLWNCLAAAIATLFIYLLLKSGLVPLRDVY